MNRIKQSWRKINYIENIEDIEQNHDIILSYYSCLRNGYLFTLYPCTVLFQVSQIQLYEIIYCLPLL